MNRVINRSLFIMTLCVTCTVQLQPATKSRNFLHVCHGAKASLVHQRSWRIATGKQYCRHPPVARTDRCLFIAVAAAPWRQRADLQRSIHFDTTQYTSKQASDRQACCCNWLSLPLTMSTPHSNHTSFSVFLVGFFVFSAAVCIL